MLLLNTESTLLSCVNVYQSLQKIPPYSSPNSSLFFGLDSYVKQYSAVNKAFYSEASNLVVIEYNADLGDKSLTPALITLICIIREKPNKKVIFITEESHVSDFKERLAMAVGDRGYSNYLTEDNDRKFTLDDFTPDSQNKLLQKQVVFQGRKRHFCTLVGEDIRNLTRTFKKIIDSKTLVKLVENEDIKINNELTRLSDIDASYSKVYEVIEPGNLTDILLPKHCPFLQFSTRPLFAISTSEQSTSEAIKEKLMQNLGIYESNICSRKEISYIKDQMTFFDKEMDRKQILIDTDKRNHFENFKLLCHSHPKNVIYWINWEDGKFIWQQLYNPDFYFARHFKYQEKIVIRDDIKNKLERVNTDFFLIFSGVNNEKEFKRYTNKNRNYFTFVSHEAARTKFQELSEENKSTHWLKFNGEDFIWQCSNGSLDAIVKYVDRQKSKIFSLNEDQFVDRLKDKEAVIITDEPGMGKSTALTKMSNKKLDSHWPIRVNLKDCRQAISALDSDNITIEMAVQFLLQTGNFDSDTDLVVVRSILEYKLSCTTPRESLPLLLLFDGFDEIKSDSERDKGKVTSLLKFLKGKAAVWVTARKHETETLQNSLSVFKTEFEELTQTEQKEFLKKFWMSRFSLMSGQRGLFEIFGLGTNKPNNKFEQYSEKLFNCMGKVFKGNINHFIGVPLRLRLFSEGFEEKFETFITSRDSNTPEFDNLDLLRIYEHFVHSTYNIYIKEKTSLSRGFGEVAKKWFTDALTEIHCRLAFKELFEDKAKDFVDVDEPPFLNEDGEIKLDGKQLTELFRIGIIQSVKGDHFEFTHKTFAEYFAARLLFNCINRKKHNPSKYEVTKQFLLEEMFRDNNEVIVNFLDCMLSKDSPLHVATLNSNLEEVNRLISENADITNLTDNLGRTALHLAAQKDHIDIMFALLRACRDTSRVPDDLGRTPLHYGASYGSLNVVRHLARTNSDIGIETLVKTGVNRFRSHSHSKLIEFVNYEDKGNKTPFHHAIVKENWYVAGMLYFYGADCNTLTEYDEALLLSWLAPEREAISRDFVGHSPTRQM